MARSRLVARSRLGLGLGARLNVASTAPPFSELAFVMFWSWCGPFCRLGLTGVSDCVCVCVCVCVAVSADSGVAVCIVIRGVGAGGLRLSTWIGCCLGLSFGGRRRCGLLTCCQHYRFAAHPGAPQVSEPNWQLAVVERSRQREPVSGLQTCRRACAGKGLG